MSTAGEQEQIRSVIFDFDGTLHDTLRIYPAAFAEGYNFVVERGLAPARSFSAQEVSGNVGLTAEEAWAKLCPDLPLEVREQAAYQVGLAMDRMLAEGRARLFPGVEQMLDRVHASGLNCIFLSNCRHAYQQAARKAFGLDRWFSAYYNAEEFKGAPKERIFESIAVEQKGGFIAVGDRYKDLTLAAAHKLPSVGCLYGCGSEEELAGATVLAHSPAEVGEAILTLAFPAL